MEVLHAYNTDLAELSTTKSLNFGVFFSGSALRSIMTNGIDPFQEGIAVGNRNVLNI